MIAHVVLFEPRADLSDAERGDLLEGLRLAARDVPGVRAVRVGRRVRHGVPGYEQLMGNGYSFAAIVEFDTVDDLRAYLAHPAHERVGRHFVESSARALAYDYEMVDAAEGAALLE